MATMNRYEVTQASDKDVAHGDLEDWLYSQGIMAFTFELGKEHDPDDPTPIFEANLEPILYLIDISDNLSQAFLPEWTMMYYMAADNSLSSEISDDLNQMKQIGSNDELNIIALADRSGDADTKAYFVSKDELELIQLSEINSSWKNEVRMERQSTMESFI